MSEEDYIAGSRSAWIAILQTSCRHLGYDDVEAARASWIVERELAIQALRDFCKYYGDNDWDSNLSLDDIIEKHLRRHLDEGVG